MTPEFGVNPTSFFAAKFLSWLVFWFVLKVVKVERKRMEEKIVKEKTKSLVGLKEKLLCLSIDEKCASKQVNGGQLEEDG